MPKQNNQKLKMLLLMKILLDRTDESHSMSMHDLIEALAASGVSAERKSVYDDLETLRFYGLGVQVRRDRTVSYYVARRLFETPELKLLVDAIASARFITQKKSRELIKKVESLTSVYEAQKLHRQVYVANRVKAVNESIYLNVNRLHMAISSASKVGFQYSEWTLERGAKLRIRKRLRHGGRRYIVSPWGLVWAQENYYLVGYDSLAGKIKHYRVDKMSSLQVLGEWRDGQEEFAHLDLALYTRKMFGMYGGEEAEVKLMVANRLVGVIADRFGSDIPMTSFDQDHFQVRVKVEVSPRFLGWVFGFGTDMRILSPGWVCELMHKQTRELLALYQSDESPSR